MRTALRILPAIILSMVSAGAHAEKLTVDLDKLSSSQKYYEMIRLCDAGAIEHPFCDSLKADWVHNHPLLVSAFIVFGALGLLIIIILTTARNR